MATMTNPMEMMIDASMRNLSTFCWAQEQGEKIVRSWMDQNAVSREEGQKLAARFAEAAKENQKALQALVENTVRMTLEAYRVPQMKVVEEMNRRIDEMNAQIDRLIKQN